MEYCSLSTPFNVSNVKHSKNETVEPPACMLLHRMLPLVLDTRFLDLDFRNFENNLLSEIFPLYENHKTLDCE